MQAFADRDDVHDAHAAKVGFRRDIALQPGAERLAEEEAEDRQSDCKRDEQQLPGGGTRPAHRDKGKRRRKKRGGGNIGAASLMDGEPSFTRADPVHRLGGGGHDVILGEVSHQVKAGRVGMSTHGHIFILAG